MFAFLLLCSFFCVSCSQTQDPKLTQWEKQAQNVNIIRDEYGVAHIYGKTDADCVFGLMYAQCEDDFSRVESNYITMLGRTAEKTGRNIIYEICLCALPLILQAPSS
jgi:acyl-homoserine lactone acylase PvdQ